MARQWAWPDDVAVVHVTSFRRRHTKACVPIIDPPHGLLVGAASLTTISLAISAFVGD